MMSPSLSPLTHINEALVIKALNKTWLEYSEFRLCIAEKPSSFNHKIRQPDKSFLKRLRALSHQVTRITFCSMWMGPKTVKFLSCNVLTLATGSLDNIISYSWYIHNRIQLSLRWPLGDPWRPLSNFIHFHIISVIITFSLDTYSRPYSHWTSAFPIGFLGPWSLLPLGVNCTLAIYSHVYDITNADNQCE